MLQITCPWCGKRDEPEFTCGGELPVRPEPALQASDEEWTNYLYFRNNKKGLHTEVWRHTHGCRQWFIADRDTMNHEVRNIRKINAASDQVQRERHSGA